MMETNTDNIPVHKIIFDLKIVIQCSVSFVSVECEYVMWKVNWQIENAI